MKQNIGQKLALYPTPATVVGTVGEEGRVTHASHSSRNCWRRGTGKVYGETLK